MTSCQRGPVLWSLSKRSGFHIQAPLFAGLSERVRTYVVCPAANPLVAQARARNAVLATPATIERPAEAGRFLRRIVPDRALLRRELAAKASLVHVTMSCPWDAVYLSAARHAGVPVLLTLHDGQRHPGEESWLLERIEDRIIALADAIVCLSGHVRELVARRTGRPVLLVEDGHLTQVAPPLLPRRVPDGRPPRVLFLGRIREYKGLDLLLDSLAVLQERGIAFELVIAGSGDLAPYADKLARLGSVSVQNAWLDDEQVRDALRGADIMALPYREASQSGIAQDARWAALPSVATRVGALPRQFRENEDALFADNDPTAFANALQRLLTEPDLYRRLSQGAYAAFEDLGLAKVADRWRDLYASLGSLP